MKVTLYTKEECGLCREAEELLRRLARKIRFDLELVDIEGHPDLHSRYWDRVPVVAVEGKEVAAAPLDEGRLRAVLRA
ncbi:MAG: glutaredoxin family protein [Chloroflexi bacterium]|nr:glutaredoxin family protein [Chloroflexota bacterium]